MSTAVDHVNGNKSCHVSSDLSRQGQLATSTSTGHILSTATKNNRVNSNSTAIGRVLSYYLVAPRLVGEPCPPNQLLLFSPVEQTTPTPFQAQCMQRMPAEQNKLLPTIPQASTVFFSKTQCTQPAVIRTKGWREGGREGRLACFKCQK